MGITFPRWIELLRENNFAIDPPYRRAAFRVTMGSLVNWFGRGRVRRQFGQQIAAAQVQAPIFVLGHWRSGTTLLHEILSLDERFAYPNLLQVSNPNTFLIREPLAERALAEQQRQKRPMDNVIVSYRSPGEDEFALAALSLRSVIIGWSFPRSQARYDRYLTFRAAPPEDAKRWQESLLDFLKQVTVRQPGKPLLLKSPSHTGKIKLLLELFPDARFVHIHRNPYVVFQSTKRLHETNIVHNRYQDSPEDPTEGILRRYVDLHEAFFADRTLIPPGRYCEVQFEQLERNIVGEIERVYSELELGEFEVVQPKVEAYAAEKADYQKNVHPALDEDLRRRIAQAWRRCFDEWGYPV